VVDHRYGGAWTELKLEAVTYYLECFTGALSKRPFDLWYIDGFAGTGSRTVERETGGLFHGAPISLETATLAGSARRALAVKPPFHHFIFIEKHPDRFAALSTLKQEFLQRDIQCLPGDANAELVQLATRNPWLKKDRGAARGVVFLDPYALQVEWSTLAALAATRVLDVWYLFPIRDAVRQLARQYQGIGSKEPRLDRVLNPRWRELYRPPRVDEQVRQLNFLDADEAVQTDDPVRKDKNWREVEGWFRGELEGLFPYVSEPLPLLTPGGRQIFSLFLAVSNPSVAAVELAKYFVKYVMKHFAPAASR
jgi:three-Cys-motif partner protein